MGRRKRRGEEASLDRIPIGRLLRAAGDRVGTFIWDKVGTWTGVFLLLLPLVGDLVANGAKWVGFDPSPFFYANLVMSGTSYVTLPLWIIVQKVKDREQAKREAKTQALLEEIRDRLNERRP